MSPLPDPYQTLYSEIEKQINCRHAMEELESSVAKSSVDLLYANYRIGDRYVMMHR